jgi:hypothetical protein
LTGFDLNFNNGTIEKQKFVWADTFWGKEFGDDYRIGAHPGDLHSLMDF